MPLFFEQVNNFILDPYGIREGPTFTNRWSGSPSAPGSSSNITTNPNAPLSPPTSNTLQGRGADCPPDPPVLPPSHNQPSHPVADSSIYQFGSAASASRVLQGTEDGAISRGSPVPQAKAPAEYLSIPHPAPPASPIPPTLPTSQSILKGAKDFKIENSVLTNVQGNAVIFRFDSGAPPNEEFKSVLVNHMAGFITVRDLDKIEKRTLNQAIRDLPRTEAAYDDYVSGDRRRVACFEGTRQTLLEEIAECVASPEGARAYLLFGIAGVGKSTIAQTVSKRADNLRVLGASFFFSRDEADRRNAKKFFTTIAFQLCTYDADFAQAIGTALTEGRGAAATSKDPQQQLKALILEPLQAVAKSRSLPTAIVVDALDECDTEDAPTVLLALDQLVQALPFFKVILTTRPQPHLQDILNLLGAHRLFRMEDIEARVVEHDIQLYLQYNLSQDQVRTRLPRLRQKWAASDEEINALVRAAGVLFIIASTAVLYILDKAACNPGSRMKALQEGFSQNRTPFNTLNDFYTVIVRSAVPLGCERNIVERYQAVVGTIVLIEDPLPISALANLIDMLEDDVYYVLDNLQSVISLGSNGVPLVYHKSFPDYITDDQRCQDVDLCITPKDHHTRLATCCLRIMNRHLKRNILSLSGPAQYVTNKRALKEEKVLKENIQRAILPEIHYASVHWASHAKQADFRDGHLATELRTFVETHLLHWLEVLSWTHEMDIAYPSLSVVLEHQIVESGVRQILYDALRFISRDYEKIKRSALYIYHSALPFTPTESHLYKNYKHEILLCRIIGGPAQWDVQISEHKHDNFFHHIAFGKDSSQFASWSIKSVKLWDATSGAPIRTFHGNEIAFAGNFSVFAAAQGCSVTIHTASSSIPIASFNHTAKVIKTAVSFDGFRLAAGLESGIVRMWDIEKGVSIADLDGYDGRRPEFSPGGYVLALPSRHVIALWNGAVTVARLEHEAENLTEFAFSGDGTRLATLAWKSKVSSLRLWNGENGEFIAVATDVGGRLAVSANGSECSLVATWGGKEVQLWSGDSLVLVGALPIRDIESLALSGDMLAVTSESADAVILYEVKNCTSIATLQVNQPMRLAFSPSGIRLAAGTGSGGVHMWDVQSIRESTLTPRQQLSPITALTFSPDCSRLASGRDDGSFELWDTGHMGQPIACHRLRSGRIRAVAFSPDANQLASGSGDRRVSFWGGGDGAQIGTLEHSLPGSLTSLEISSRLLVVGTVEVVALWDRASLHLIHTFKQGSHSLSFSLDGSTLVARYERRRRYDVAVLDTEKLVETLRFTIDGKVVMFSPSPDGSHIAAQYASAEFKVFTINKAVLHNPKNEDLIWVPHLNGTPIFWGRDCLFGRFSASHNRVPVLNIPREFRVQKFASRSSMFALGCEDGRILLVQPPYNY